MLAGRVTVRDAAIGVVVAARFHVLMRMIILATATNKSKTASTLVREDSRRAGTKRLTCLNKQPEPETKSSGCSGRLLFTLPFSVYRRFV